MKNPQSETNNEFEHDHMIIELTADLVSAYVSNNTVSRSDLTSLISEVHTALRKSSSAGAAARVPASRPAVPIKESMTKDYIICLEDGKRFKSLKRHLSSHFGMTPEEYREKWGLPPDYPMVAPNYAKSRSRLAKKMGLGRKPGTKIKRKK